MAISLVGLDGAPFSTKDMDATGDNFITQRVKVVFSGNYTMGGDTLNLTSIVPPGAGPRADTGTVLPLEVIEVAKGSPTVPSLSAAGGFYAAVEAAVPTLANYLLKVFKNSAGNVAEYNNGAYGTDVLTDGLILEFTWRKFA
jgi:hypothetical protein